jgi:histone H3/H4
MPRIKQTPKRNAPALDIPRATFLRLVREITGNYRSEMRWTAEALEALQGDAEQFLGEHFGRAKELSEHFGHSTVSLRHFEKRDLGHVPITPVPGAV